MWRLDGLMEVMEGLAGAIATNEKDRMAIVRINEQIETKRQE
jgi:hypothetical protein